MKNKILGKSEPTKADIMEMLLHENMSIEEEYKQITKILRKVKIGNYDNIDTILPKASSIINGALRIISTISCVIGYRAGGKTNE